MYIGFERIHPLPLHPSGVTEAMLAAYDWSSRSAAVIQFKTSIKKALRKVQLGRCCFCRRRMGDSCDTDIEHFVDKDKYEEFCFEIRNLALSCGTCNSSKHATFSSWRSRMNHRFSGPLPRLCPVLNITIHVGDSYPFSPNAFRWLNPHLHNYSDHIAVERSLVFKGKTPIGRRTVKGLKLNDLGALERQVLYEKLEMRGGRLAMLASAIGEMEDHRAYDVGFAVAQVIKRRRQMSKLPKVE